MAKSAWLCGATAALACVTAGAGAAGRLESRIDMARTELRTGDDVRVRLTLRNTGDAPLALLRWATPVDGIEDEIFEIERNGEAVTYIGRHYKRPAPTRQDYLTIPAGAARAFDVELTAAWDFSQPGAYSVRYRTGAELDGRFVGVESDAVTLFVDGEPIWPALQEALERPVEAPAPDALTPQFVNCSSTRQSSTTSALNSAQTYSGNALAYLNAGTRGPRYTTWFGTYTSSRYSTVRGNFGAIDNAIRTKTIAFYCDCTSSAYAYVYSNDPYKIHLCNAFWSAPQTGTDSKAGTIIHELSHFNVVAGTSDYAYGQSACKSLALSNPARATRNADSHEYFAENTPAQN
jgi:peptidyl-Lys metalloendopeptidase